MANLKVNRGTTYIIHYQHQHDSVTAALTGCTVYFTLKSAEYDTDADDSDALVAKTLIQANGDIPDHLVGAVDIEVLPGDTDTLTPGKYHYDIKVKESDNRVYKVDEGTIKLDGSPTNRSAA